MHARPLNQFPSHPSRQPAIKTTSARTNPTMELAPKFFPAPRSGLENILPNTRESARSPPNQSQILETLLPRSQLPKQSSIVLKNPKDLFKKLTTNKNNANNLNGRSEERNSENSTKNRAKNQNHPQQTTRPLSREKLPANICIQAPRPLQGNVQQLINLGLASKGLIARQVTLKQITRPQQQIQQQSISTRNVHQQEQNFSSINSQNNQSLPHPQNSLSTSLNVQQQNSIQNPLEKQISGRLKNPTTFKELMKRGRSKEKTQYAALKLHRLKTEYGTIDTGTTFATEKQIQPATTTNAQRNREDSSSRRAKHVRHNHLTSNIDLTGIPNKNNITGELSQQNALRCNELIRNTTTSRLHNNNGNLKNESKLHEDPRHKRSLNAFESVQESCSLDRLEIVQVAPSIVFEQEQFSNQFDPATIAHLIAEETNYALNPHYLSQKQKHVKWQMRSILLDWIQEVCSDYLFKRETFYFTVSYVDRFLDAKIDIEKNQLQLVGLAALFLAAKMEEVYTPKVENMLSAANNTYTMSQLIAFEKKMLISLSFKTTPPTLNLWANWYMTQWDNFTEESDYVKRHILARSKPLPRFRQPTEQAYALFRELMQLLDAAVLEIQTLQYKSRAIIAAFMYVLLGKELNQFSKDKIVEEFPCSSLYLLDESFAFNDLFAKFMNECFAMSLLDLLPTIQYVATFFGLPIVINLPVAAKVDKENVLQVNLLGTF